MSAGSNQALSQRLSARRRGRDRIATVAINAAGIGVIAVLLLMLIYLVRVSLPLAEGVAISAPLTSRFDAATAWVAARRNGEVWRLPALPGGACEGACRVSGMHAMRYVADRLYLYSLESRSTPDGSADPRIARRERVIEEVFLGSLWRFHSVAGQVLIAGVTRHGALGAWFIDEDGSLHNYELHSSELHSNEVHSNEVHSNEVHSNEVPGPDPGLPGFSLAGSTLLLDVRHRRVLLVQGDRFLDWRLAGPGGESGQIASAGTLSGMRSAVAAVGWGPDRETLLLSADSGALHQYDAGREGLPPLGAPLALDFVASQISSEQERRVSYLLAPDGALRIIAPSSGQQLFTGTLAGFDGEGPFAVTRDGSGLIVTGRDRLTRWTLHNPYPETGWRALWSAQWFSRYDGEAQVWQPDGAAIGVLPKLSLSPLLYGTFKAAIYGMLMAIPLALGAAIYSGYFLSSRARNRIKPAIEMLEAFPTVVLGFIAGLWLAPLLGDYLALVLFLPLLLLGLPLLLALIHLALQYLSPAYAIRPPRAWLVAIAYILGIGTLLLFLGDVETLFFQDSLRGWLWREFEIPYDQRNALLVGLAMGLALTPTLFSIIEDAIHAVPGSLSDASLALGATRWQSLAWVVLPAASPAIVSALLIGLSRGLGETMIVLLATGNTPLMEPGLFSGLRSISASIASELPEAGPGSVHFRVLFLAALVLFALTFVFNTIAELFRQRLRYTYAGH